MENSHRFFENRACKYFPCHKGLENLNCLFCYCPLYCRENCPGNLKFIEEEGRMNNQSLYGLHFFPSSGTL